MNLNGRTINPGELRTSVQFDNPTVATDAGGAQSETWSKLADIWAKWTNAHGLEAITSEALESAQRATVLCRYNASIGARSSILKDGQRWMVISVDDIQNRHEYMELVVELAKGTV